ncbi:MAG: hypothetical protein JXR85_09440, partial [Deltaproteobacteria bacterium]|nr:hypothetical protein [Deltaproteobacteria bacterium]
FPLSVPASWARPAGGSQGFETGGYMRIMASRYRRWNGLPVHSGRCFFMLYVRESVVSRWLHRSLINRSSILCNDLFVPPTACRSYHGLNFSVVLCM